MKEALVLRKIYDAQIYESISKKSSKHHQTHVASVITGFFIYRYQLKGTSDDHFSQVDIIL